MRRTLFLLPMLCYMACDQNADTKAPETMKAPDVAFQVINARADNDGQFYDIYLTDTASIKPLNDYLKDKYNKDRSSWIEINYFNDSIVAKTYFNKQLDNTISDKAKDRLFKSFIANYKYNPSTKYEKLVYEH